LIIINKIFNKKIISNYISFPLYYNNTTYTIHYIYIIHNITLIIFMLLFEYIIGDAGDAYDGCVLLNKIIILI